VHPEKHHPGNHLQKNNLERQEKPLALPSESE
jgi:hypothetical protein